MNDVSDEDWLRLANEVRSRRLRLGLTQIEVAKRGGPSDTTLSKIEAGTWRPKRAANTLRKVDQGLGWSAGSATGVLEGVQPKTSLREIPIAMPAGGGAQQAIADAIERSIARRSRNPELEVQRQLDLLEAVRSAWAAAQPARELGCSDREIENFTMAGFGLLISSGTIGIIASDKQALSDLIQDFDRATSGRPPAAEPDPAADEVDDTSQSDVDLAGGRRRGGGEDEIPPGFISAQADSTEIEERSAQEEEAGR
ncbi:XRE family transcriptional regulator [Gordonia oryzae]|uniref:XRE family transcriptional regulator n=2 Tax=Gordonia oryzae TaxID=2487349 RepID=A0A3N4GPX5_9ACTN|nr:XRE family transcriptional regulator [Gordonia oryzae]